MASRSAAMPAGLVTPGLPAGPLDVLVVGGGIVGLATLHALASTAPGLRVALVEKEQLLADHQTGHNSGVIHSGIYYKPNSLKARMCTEGNRRLVAFCEANGIAHEICGKVIVATRRDELPRLQALLDRARDNGIAHDRLGPRGLRDVEPHVAGIAAIHVHTTGIVDYRAVAVAYARIAASHGATVHTGVRVSAFERRGPLTRVRTTAGDVEAAFVVNCTGLHADRVAAAAGDEPPARIVPFRGEYYELAEHRRHLVKGLVYPVPDPAFPFLGVHLTRMIDGSVHAGPNAVLAWKREGYTKRDVDLVDLRDALGYRGFRRLARANWYPGSKEIARSFSKQLFLRSLQRLVPELERADLVPSAAGVRAQALTPEGGLVDDFLFVDGVRSLHVCNAPSPAATSSLEIGRAIAERVVAGPAGTPGRVGEPA